MRHPALQRLADGTCARVLRSEFYQGLPLYDRVKTVFSMHNVAFQGQFSDTVMEDILGLAHIPAAASQLRCDACSIKLHAGRPALCRRHHHGEPHLC